MSPSSSPFDAGPFGFLAARGAVVEATSAPAWLQAFLDAESALAQAHADAGTVTVDLADVVVRACRADLFDVDGLFTAAALGGNPVVPLVPSLRAVVGPAAASAVHVGATSQDIVDTAAVLIVRRCTAIVLDGLARAATTVAGLQERHGGARLIGRTLLQHAVPTTFATVTGRWAAGLQGAAAALERVDRELPLQLGGPVGDLASFGGQGPAVAAAMGRRLDLVVPPAPWHGQRTPIAAIAGGWGTAAAAVAGLALDVVLLAHSDVGEVREAAEGAGGSSSMAHKRNPVAAVSARAAALQAPGLVATLLHCAGGHELERAAGPWHAEWPALQALLRCTASAVEWLSTSLERLGVDEARMAQNLAGAGGWEGP